MDEWVRLYDDAEGQLEALAVELRASHLSALGVTVQRALVGRLDSVGQDVARLDNLTWDMEQDPTAHPMEVAELERRQGLLANLNMFLANVRALNTGNTGGAVHRTELLDGVGISSLGLGAGADTSSSQESTLQQQTEEQDERLDLIGEGLERLKGMSFDINYELESQVSLLAEIDGRTDSADRNMRANIRSVESVHRSSYESWCSLGVMLILLQVIVVLLAIDLPCVNVCSDRRSLPP
jgi:hypothetical protein